MRKFLPAIIGWLVLVGALYAGYKFIYPLFLPEEEQTDVQTTVVSRGDLRQSVPADGIVEPSDLVEVKSKASGVVEELFVETGETVEAGQVLVELDKEEILGNKRQAEADLAAAEADLVLTTRNLSPQQKASRESAIEQAEVNLQDAQKRFDRIEELHGRGYATDQELEDASTSLNQARLSLDSAKEQYDLDLKGAEPERIDIAEATILRREAQLDNVNEELANTTIRAPITGMVLTRPIEIGTAVASGTTGNTGGTVVCTIGDMSNLVVRAQIEETDLGKVTVGANCRVTFDSFQGWVWKGAVQKIEPQGEQSGQGSAGTRFPVEIALDLESAAMEGGGRRFGGGRPGMGRPGGASPGGSAEVETSDDEEKEEEPDAIPQLRRNMTANVEIVLEDHPNVLIVPAQYVQYEEGKPFIEVADDPEDTENRERRDVELGFTDGLRFEVLSGVEEGETVVLERAIEGDN